MKEEYKIRLDEILSGPWVKKSEDAKKLIYSKKAEKKFLKDNRISMDQLKDHDRSLEKKLNRLLAPHWKRKQFSDEESILRDSFDEALTLMKLLEIAIRTNYLSLDSVKNIATKEILGWLWSKPSRKFILNYDYFEVIQLAKRLNIDLGLKINVKLPKIKSNEINFAMFLTQFISFYEDEEIDDFLGFLDGYTEDDYEDEIFNEFLSEGENYEYTLDELDRFFTLYSGMQKFVLQLYDFFKILPKKEQMQYGIFYAYWLSKFFGYSYEKGKFERDEKYLFDWSAVSRINVLNRLEFSFLSSDKEINEASKSNLYRATQSLRKIWETTMLSLSGNKK